MYKGSPLDLLTLEYIQKSMPADQLKKAEEAGAFDLLKGLHPQKVLVHGKHGPYYATRMVSDGQEQNPKVSVQNKPDEKKTRDIDVHADIEKYAGRSMKDIYAEEGERGVMRAFGARYVAEHESNQWFDPDYLDELYGSGESYTPAAAARAMEIWTAEKLHAPETEDMDDNELRMWYDENREDMLVSRDGMMWGCSLIRMMEEEKINDDSESAVIAGVSASILSEVIEKKSEVYDGTLYRGVILPEGSVEEILDRGKVDLEGMSSFSESESVARQFMMDSPALDIWQDEITDAVIFVIEKDAEIKSYEVMQSKFAREQEHIVGAHPPFEVTKITVDEPDGVDLLVEEPDDDYVYGTHVHFVYLKG